jgi:hypothetical protein
MTTLVLIQQDPQSTFSNQKKNKKAKENKKT